MKTTIITMRQTAFLLMVIFIIGCGDFAKSAENEINNSSIERTNISTKSIEDSLLLLRERINILENSLKINESNIKNNKAEIDTINSSANDAGSQAIGLFFLSILICTIILVLAIWLVFKIYLTGDKLTKKVLGNDTFQEELKERIKNVVLPEKELNRIDIRVKEQIRLHEKETSNRITKKVHNKNNNDENDYDPPLATKYLSGNNGKRFNIVDTSPDNSFFKIINEKGDTAEFVFNGNEEEAIAKKVFNEDISKIISGNQKSAKTIKTFKPGEIKRVVDYWEVTSPIEVELS